MKKKKSVLVFLLLAFILCLFTNKISVKADSNNLKTMGTYLKSVPVNKTIKVYVQEDLKGYLEENGIKVYSENRGGWWFIKDYYYIADKYVERIVQSRSIKNDIDSLIFMVNELEDMAKEINANQYKNITLGYIRSISADYVDGYFESWSLVSGSIDTDAIARIKESENKKIGLRFYEYFAQFLGYMNDSGSYEKGKYNEALHGEVRDMYKNTEREPLKLVDPVSKRKGIDLLHMFASIDGIYCKTQASPLTIGNNMQRDVVSWNGDLQQAALNINSLIKTQRENNEEVLNLSNADYGKMNLIFSKDDYGNDRFGCPEEDVLADIDAMSITKLFVDHDNTTIAYALSAYYELIRNNQKMRFKTFIKTILLEEERNEIIINKSEIERFELEVANQFNIKIVKIGGLNYYYNFNYYAKDLFLGFTISRKGGFTPLDFWGEFPSEEVRVFVVKSFIEYVEYNLN